MPDDLRTRSALADSYLTEYWAHTQLISVRGLDYVLQRGRSQRLRPPRAALPPTPAAGSSNGAGGETPAFVAFDTTPHHHSLSPQRPAAVAVAATSAATSAAAASASGLTAADPDPSLGPGEWDRVVCANRALLSYHELQSSLLHTRCAKSKLSYRDDILGMAIDVAHFARRHHHHPHPNAQPHAHPPAGPQSQSRGRPKGDGARGDAVRKSSELPIVRIDKVRYLGPYSGPYLGPI